VLLLVTATLPLMAVTATAAVVLRWRFVVVEVDGISMRPTYEPGDRVLVRRCAADRVRHGQVVVVQAPDPDVGWSRLPSHDGDVTGRRWYIKRAAAVAGDPIPAGVAHAVGSPGSRVPEGRLVVLGDNVRSDDSRRWGYLPGELVLGVAVRRMGSRSAR
jgi:signal peptidase I